MIAAAGSPEKCKRLEEIGADETVDYHETDFADYARKTTGSVVLMQS